MATIQVFYPADAKFNMDYYMSTHMPLVQEKWGKHNLKSWSVNKIGGTASGEPAPYGVMATLNFGSMDDFQAAAGGPDAPTVMGDIPNFSDKQPTIMAAELVGTS